MHKCVHELWGSLAYNAGIDLILFSTPSTLISQTTSQDPDWPLGGEHAGQI